MGTRSEFHGQGIQNSGSGNLSIGGDVNIQTTRDKEYDQLLADLRKTNPLHDKKRIQETKGGLLEDSYRWILDHDDFLQWQNDPESRLLWIRGDPGKGKTMLLCGIIDQLETASATTAQPAYFFCQATDDRLNSATAVLRGLLYLLCVQHPNHVKKYIQDEYSRAGKQLFEDVNAWTAMSEILTKILNEPAMQGKVVIIDGLDECVNDRARLLDLIARVSPKSHAKWIVSSRNWPEIEERLDRTSQRITLRLELNNESISRAVHAYICHTVGVLAEQKEYSTETRQAVQRHLEDNSNDTYLWVALVCEQLQPIDEWDVADVLKEMPTSLENMYRRMIQKIEQLGRRDPELSRIILSTVTAALRPLHLLELAHLASFPTGFPRTKASVVKIVSKCGSFLTIKDDIVYTIHQSAQDFLTSHARLFPSGVEAEHHAIFTNSLEILTRELKRDIYSLYAPGVHIEEVSPPQPDSLVPLKYSCIHWVDHLLASNPTDSGELGDLQDDGKIHEFLRTKFLNWLEALSLLRNMSHGVLAMQKLDALMAGEKSSQVAKLVQDASRFSQSHWMTVGAAPLQAYLSALVFSPQNSVVRQIYEHEARVWVTLMPRVEENWNACILTLRNHRRYSSVKQVAWSPDGRWLASGCQDGTIKIWDAATGTCLQTLQSHQSNHWSLAWLPDGQRLASATSCGSIRLWDAATGRCVQTLEGHGAKSTIESVAISADGQRLASAGDSSVKVWDLATGDCVQTLEGYCKALSMAWLAGGQRLALAFRDGTVGVLDIVSATCVQTFEGHRRYGTVVSIAFSPDGQWFASAGTRTIAIWNVATGECTRRIMSDRRNTTVFSVAFSSDGGCLASGIDDMIKIWDLATGACLQKLEGRAMNEVFSLALSPDRRRLAAGRYHGEVEIWDMTIGTNQQAPENHDSEVLAVCISPNMQVASRAHNTVKVWDVATGRCMYSLHQEHWRWLRWRDAWLRDNSLMNIRRDCAGSDQNMEADKHVYSMSDDRGWIMKNGKRLLFVPEENRPLYSVSAFSGSTVALGCGSGRVLWMTFSEDQKGAD